MERRRQRTVIGPSATPKHLRGRSSYLYAPSRDEPAIAGDCGRCGQAAARKRPAACRHGSAGAPGWRTACRRSARCPSQPHPGGGSPASSWTCRRRSGRRIRSLPRRNGETHHASATVASKRLSRPLISLVASMCDRLGTQGLPGRHATEPSSRPLPRGTLPRAVPRMRDAALTTCEGRTVTNQRRQ